MNRYLRILTSLAMPTLLVWSGLAQDAPAPMTLAQAITYTLAHSPELQKLELDHDSQQQQTIIAEAAFAFKLNYEASHSVDSERTGNKVTLNREIAGGYNVSAVSGLTRDGSDGDDSAYVSITLSKKLLGSDSTVNATTKAIEDSLVDELIAMNAINRQKRRLVSFVSGTFYKTVRDMQSKTIQERRLERARRNLEMTIEREKPLDIITARIQIPENELAVVRSERAIENDLDGLKVVLGMPVEQPVAISSEFVFGLQETDLSADIAYALENHEDFVNNRLERRKIARDVGIAESELWPDVFVSANHRADSDADSFDIGHGDSEQTFVVGVAWEIGRKADKARYRRALNRLRRNERDHFILQQNKMARLADLDRQLRENARSIDLQQQRIELVARQVDLYRDRYENGEIDILELIRSQNDLENSKVELVNLQTNYLEQLATYNFEAGR